MLKKIFFGICFACSLTLSAQTDPNVKAFDMLKNLQIFSEAYKQLHLNYVDEINPGELMKTGLDAMLGSLDPYTNYFPESDIEDYKIMTLGQYGGIGALVHYRNGAIYISECYENYPAFKAGLQPGDKILKVNGQDAVSKNSDDIGAMLKGQAGTKITLLIEREGQKPFEKEITREEIKLDNVSYVAILRDSIGYIKLDGFTQDAAHDVKDAFLKLKAQGMKALIFDLRGNGGGLMNEAIDIVNLFYEKNQAVVSMKGKVQERNVTYYTKQQPLDLDIPIAVMVNRGSASSSEIVAGALQDLDRAVIIGQRSFGKGLVQNVLPLDFNAQMKITIAKYYIPSGRCVQAIDYSEKDENGHGKKLPDSLRSAFKTKGGRTVYDGDGIEPDVELEPEMISNIAYSLVTKYMVFDYANQYKRKNASIPDVDQFVITDEEYENFKQFLSGKDFDYTTKTEYQLDEFEQIAKKEEYYDALKDALAELRVKFQHDKHADLEKNKDEIKELLREEIVSRYYYQKGRIRASLMEDKEIDTAIATLKDKTKYKNILKGSK